MSSSRAAAAAESVYLCPTLCDPRDGSPQAPWSLARVLGWVAMAFSVF